MGLGMDGRMIRRAAFGVCLLVVTSLQAQPKEITLVSNLNFQTSQCRSLPHPQQGQAVCCYAQKHSEQSIARGATKSSEYSYIVCGTDVYAMRFDSTSVVRIDLATDFQRIDAIVADTRSTDVFVKGIDLQRHDIVARIRNKSIVWKAKAFPGNALAVDDSSNIYSLYVRAAASPEKNTIALGYRVTITGSMEVLFTTDHILPVVTGAIGGQIAVNNSKILACFSHGSLMYTPKTKRAERISVNVNDETRLVDFSNDFVTLLHADSPTPAGDLNLTLENLSLHEANVIQRKIISVPGSYIAHAVADSQSGAYKRYFLSQHLRHDGKVWLLSTDGDRLYFFDAGKF